MPVSRPARDASSPAAGAATHAPPLLELARISKSFPGVRALDAVSLRLYPGQVTALVGENGAGKSTIVKILTGIYQPDEGSIALDGRQVTLPTAHAAAAAGVTAIHQETVLFDDLSVAENIFLGHAPRTSRGLIDWRAMGDGARAMLARVGAEIDPDVRLRDLGIANKHLVAVARALSIDARVVIMDEPTAALSHKEILELFAIVEKLRDDGKAILFISHKFDEVFRISDRYTVFRDGKMVGEGRTSEATEDALVRLMVGRSIDAIFPARDAAPGDEALRVDGLCHPTEFDDISFAVRRGEILGFYGLVGAGRSEVMQALFGITRLASGSVTVDGRPASIRSPATAIGHGLVYVPEDRGQQGAIRGLPIFQNVTLPSLARVSRRGFLRMAEEFRLARDYTRRLELRAAALDQELGQLSGGNQQKVVIAKWLATKPRVIILDEPTKGIDIGSKAAVHAFMAELAVQGLAIIMVSSEIPEILGMSDRVVVMREGRMVDTLDRAGLTPEKLVRAAAGITEVA
jgi:rhamnose transport system ATP-binding protein